MGDERPVPKAVQQAAATLRKRLAEPPLGPYPSPCMGRGQYEALLTWIEREVQRRG